MAIEPVLTTTRNANPMKHPSSTKRSTGPHTPQGKRASSKNLTRHGILSTSPVVGSESETDWEERLQAMRVTLKPVGQGEEVLVHQAAFNRWRRARAMSGQSA